MEMEANKNIDIDVNGYLDSCIFELYIEIYTRMKDTLQHHPLSM